MHRGIYSESFDTSTYDWNICMVTCSSLATMLMYLGIDKRYTQTNWR